VTAAGVGALLAAYVDGRLDPAEVVEAAYERAGAAGAPTWISLAPWAQVRARLAGLRGGGGPGPDAPLWGVPFAIKDNIDLAGVSTTAACPAFATTPGRSAHVVERLVAAGAIPVGKTNLDQFATGLTGTRTPYGACASTADARYVSGGSSSGSAVAVADGTVPFSLGTDTAGSGRVPAAFNGIVGLKPSVGLVSTAGVVPASRSLDCVSVFAADVDGAARVLAVAAGVDPADPFSRPGAAWAAGAAAARGGAVRVGVPSPASLRFAGDDAAAGAWAAARAVAVRRGWELVEVDLEPHFEAAALLYEGPWLAERWLAIGAFVAAHPREVDPVVASVVAAGADVRGADVFAAMHRLAELRRATAPMWEDVDALLVPSTPTIYTHAEIADAPVERNAVLGTYTNFVNLLDLCAVAAPGPVRADGLPAGVTLIGPRGADMALCRLAAAWAGEAPPAAAAAAAVWAGEGAPVAAGATHTVVAATAAATTADGSVPVAVVGAHLSGEPLNGQLTALGGRLLETTRTSAAYRLFALPGDGVARPGLVGGFIPEGDGIEAELWALSAEALGRLLVGIPAPLGIGTVTLADGRQVKGFLCEAAATAGARDITAFGGWRAYRAADVAGVR
jgi:allophanate hydrolase